MSKLSKTKIKVLNAFEKRTDKWTSGTFESALQKEMGSFRYGNYQTAKMTIKEADKEGLWPKTVKRYVLTLGTPGPIASELLEIYNRFYFNMDNSEKKKWGIKISEEKK